MFNSIKSAILALGAVSANTYFQDPKFEATHHRRHGPRKARNGEKLHIHLIAHTHDDVGWLKNVDQYYTGSKDRNLQQADVNLIISTVIDNLEKYPNRKFTYVEMKFFQMWWSRQDEETQNRVHKLVKEGRFEFVNAGWSMHDEACPHYEDMINNMMKGHSFLLDEFGVKPRVGWHVDPFGHSSTNPRLFADMGFEAWFFARLSWDDKDQRLADESMNFLWRPYKEHFGNQKQIFTGIMKDHYCWAQGFWYDARYDWDNDDPVVTDERLSTFNADKVTKQFVDYLLEMHDGYRGQHLMVPMGCDFSFANARLNFENMDKMIEYFNEHNDANMVAFYSTPGQYLDALYNQNVTWPVNYYDMFPYADNPKDFWTGYFTSRAGAKKQVRDGQATLHSAASIFAEKVIKSDTSDAEIKDILKAHDEILDAMGVYQHHDGISGTAKQAVADDYTKRLARAVESNNKLYAKYLEQKLKADTGITAVDGLSYCVGSQNDTMVDCPMHDRFDIDGEPPLVVVHNPSAQDFSGIVRMQAPNIFHEAPYEAWKVTAWNGTGFSVVESMLSNNDIHWNNNTQEDSRLLFARVNISAHGTAYLKMIGGVREEQVVAPANPSTQLLFHGLNNETNTARFELVKDSISQNFTINLGYYTADTGHDGYNDSSNCAEGAYLMKPERGERYQHDYGTYMNMTVHEENQYLMNLVPNYAYSLAREIDNQTDNGPRPPKKQYTRSAMVKLFLINDLVEVVVETNGIDVSDGNGKDLIVNFHFEGIDANKTFYTDSNGLEMQKRVIDYRPTWNYSGDQNISSNYYPVNSAVALRDVHTGRQVTVMNDRSQAASAELMSGTIEFMQNRRLLLDDSRGVEEPLNETDADGFGMKVNARYWIDVFDTKTGGSKQRTHQLTVDQPLQYFFSFNYSESAPTPKPAPTHKDWKPLAGIDTGKLLMLPLARNAILLRLENIFDRFDGKQEVPHVDLDKLAHQFYWSVNPDETVAPIVEITELNLSANQVESEARKTRSTKKWVAEDDEEIAQQLQSSAEMRDIYAGPSDDMSNGQYAGIALEAQRIRTFKVVYKFPEAFLQ